VQSVLYQEPATRPLNVAKRLEAKSSASIGASQRWSCYSSGFGVGADGTLSRTLDWHL
jgi:hypothetical protein